MAEYIDRKATVDALNRLCDRVCQYSKAQRFVMCSSCPLGHAFTVIEDDLEAADVAPVRLAHLVETREPMDNHQTWYRKHLCCSECGVQIRLESWDDKRCFGAGTILRENEMPSYCPNCGARLDLMEEVSE